MPVDGSRKVASTAPAIWGRAIHGGPLCVDIRHRAPEGAFEDQMKSWPSTFADVGWGHGEIFPKQPHVLPNQFRGLRLWIDAQDL